MVPMYHFSQKCAYLPLNQRIFLKSHVLSMGDIPITDSVSEDIANGIVASDGYHQHLGFKKGMAIASLNIKVLRSHLDEVQILTKNLGIHISGLNETKLDPSYPKELTSVAGYHQERLDRTCNSGGVSVYIKDSVKYKCRPDAPTDDLELICNSKLNHLKASHFSFLFGTGHYRYRFWRRRTKN